MIFHKLLEKCQRIKSKNKLNVCVLHFWFLALTLCFFSRRFVTNYEHKKCVGQPGKGASSSAGRSSAKGLFGRRSNKTFKMIKQKNFSTTSIFWFYDRRFCLNLCTVNTFDFSCKQGPVVVVINRRQLQPFPTRTSLVKKGSASKKGRYDKRNGGLGSDPAELPATSSSLNFFTFFKFGSHEKLNVDNC